MFYFSCYQCIFKNESFICFFLENILRVIFTMHDLVIWLCGFLDNHILWATQHGRVCSQWSGALLDQTFYMHAINCLDCSCSDSYIVFLNHHCYLVQVYFQFKECSIMWRLYCRSLFYNGWNKGLASGYKEDSGDAEIAGISVDRLGKGEKKNHLLLSHCEQIWSEPINSQIFSWRACC